MDNELTDEAAGRAPGRHRLEGRRILVVGAGTRPTDDPDAPIGNGRAIAALAAKEGAMVACADRDEDAARETAELVTSDGGSAEVLVADVSRAEDCAAVVAGAEARLGSLDGLVMNVGVGHGARLAGTSVEDWDTSFAVNVRAHFLVCQAALPNLAEGASVVFISSIAGIRPGSQLPAYDTSKAALGGLCRHVANEGARRLIRANVVAPGLIDTPIGRLASAGRPSRDRTPVPLQRQGTAWEIAYATVFLLSGESSYITGQTLVVDGGLTALR
jgi:NAD(P)-dependent dehydrogenase (short-subunit alcohol dehydrogenase family)